MIPLTSGQAKEEASKVEVTPVKITNHLYMLAGKGGNIGLFIGDDGTFMIDDQFAPLTEQILAAIKTIGGTHPKFLINTHYHPDHTGGNENLGEESTLIFSHDNVRKRLHDGYTIKTFKAEQSPLAPEGLPVVTFSKDITFHLNGEDIHAVFVPNAHTDGDSFIIFPKANVIHTDDIFFNGFYPFIDVEHGGNLQGMIAAADTILKLADDATTIIPGHGPLGDKAELKNYRNMLATVLKRLQKLKKAGKSVDDVIAAKPLADLEQEWGDGHFKGDQWIKLIFSSL
jgi:glyoxylase-like metal-dependent hydrolase (beta-lactamase superfamily II)